MKNNYLLVCILLSSTLLHVQSQSNPYLQYCEQIPFNPMTTCNVTCTSCSSRSQCSTCPSYLNLSQTQSSCNFPSTERMEYYEYFYAQNLKFDSTLSKFKLQSGLLTPDNTFRLCISNKYKFDIVGLFSSQDQLSFSYSFAYQVSQIAINLRLFSTSSLSIIKIWVNSKVAFNGTIQSGYTLNINSTGDTPEIDSSNVKWNIGILANDSSSYVDKIFAPIRSQMMALNNNTAQIKITVENGLINNASQSTKFWGISQVSVIAKKCRTCVSQALRNLASILGIIIGASAGIVIILLLILQIYEKVKQSKNRQEVKRSFTQNQLSRNIKSFKYLLKDQKHF